MCSSGELQGRDEEVFWKIFHLSYEDAEIVEAGLIMVSGECLLALGLTATL